MPGGPTFSGAGVNADASKVDITFSSSKRIADYSLEPVGGYLHDRSAFLFHLYCLALMTAQRSVPSAGFSSVMILVSLAVSKKFILGWKSLANRLLTVVLSFHPIMIPLSLLFFLLVPSLAPFWVPPLVTTSVANGYV